MSEPRRRKSSAERRAEIVEAALLLAAEDGPDAVTTEAIANRIGLTQPAVFRHFGHKDAIWLGIVRTLSELLKERWDRAERGLDDPEDRLLAVVGAQLTLVQSIPALPRILFAWQLTGRRKGLREAVRGLMRLFHARLAGIIADGQRAGLFRSDTPADAAAWMVLGLVQATAIRWTFMDRSFAVADEGLKAVRLALEGLCHGRPRHAPGRPPRHGAAV